MKRSIMRCVATRRPLGIVRRTFEPRLRLRALAYPGNLRVDDVGLLLEERSVVIRYFNGTEQADALWS